MAMLIDINEVTGYKVNQPSHRVTSAGKHCPVLEQVAGITRDCSQPLLAIPDVM